MGYSWTDIVAVAAGSQHTVGLRSDGTVVATGWNYHGQCDVSNWKNIRLPQEMNPGYQAAQQLMDEGKYLQAMWAFSALDFQDSAEKAQEARSCYVSSQPTLAVGSGHTVGLLSDGTVVATGWNRNSQCDVDSWSDIVAVAAGDSHTVGLRGDGTVVATVVATGWNDYGQCDVDGWTDIVAVAAGWLHTMGLRSDGTVVATGCNDDGQCYVNNWKNIRLPQ